MAERLEEFESKEIVRQQVDSETTHLTPELAEDPDRRVCKPTERGLAYTKDTKKRSTDSLFRNIKTTTQEINTLIADQCPPGVIQPIYSKFLDLYERFLKSNDDYSEFLALDEQEEYFNNVFEQRDLFVKNFKVNVENFFVSQQEINNEAECKKYSKSNAGSKATKSSLASTVSSARLKEQQRKAELLAKMESSKQRAEIELAKTRLRLEEENLELQTELAISDAKSKVLDDFEKLEDTDFNVPSYPLNSSEQFEMNTKFIKSETLTDKKPEQFNYPSIQQLNPSVKPFIPSKLNMYSEVPERMSCTKGENVVTGNHVNTGISGYGMNVAPVKGLNVERKHVDRDLTQNISYPARSWDGVGGCVSTLGPAEAIGGTDKGKLVGNHGDGTSNDIPKTGESFIANETNIPYSTNHERSYLPEDATLSVIRHLRKPSFEVKKFSGNPMEFRKFIRQFESRVCANTDDDDEKMNCLEQYTVGEANKLVTGFSHLEASIGFPAAMRELHDRYGDTQVIANAFIKRALEWPSVKKDDAKSLDEFAMFLVECQNAVGCVESMKLLEYSENLKRLVAKLPFYMHDRWRNIVYQVKGRNDVVKFSDLVRFVKDEAKKAADPVFGKEALNFEPLLKGSTNRNAKQTYTNRSKGSFATSTVELEQNKVVNKVQQNPYVKDVYLKNQNNENKDCSYCNDSAHSLDKCPRFGKLQPRERFGFLKEKGLCWACLRPGHMKRQCRNKATCSKCHFKHPTCLHFEPRTDTLDHSHTDSQKSRSADASLSPSNVANPCGQTGAGEPTCAMAIIPVKVRMKNKLKEVETYAFFDSGSSVSFCTKNLLTQLGGSGKPMQVTINTMGQPFTMNTFAVSGLQVSDMESSSSIDLPTVYTKEALPVSGDHIPTQDEINKWPHLQDLKLNVSASEIGLMIGSNIPDAYAPLEFRSGVRGSPHATRTLLGWIVWNVLRDPSRPEGDAFSGVVNRAEMTAVQKIEELQSLEVMVRDSINRDFPERLSDDRKEMSQEDKRFLEQAENSICMDNGHYCLDLPFKDRNVRVPNNHPQALQRLQALKRKMTGNSQFYEDYKEFMGKILDKGFAEIVPPKDLYKDDGDVWYIPHHGVYHPRKPGKIRVVFDCSATYQGVCLNSLLLPGPDLTNGLLGVLLKFRQDPIAVMADIESMFFQVRVSKKDVDYLRFLWWPGGDLTENPVPYRMLVHLFGAVSSPSCSNFALRRTADDNALDYPSNVARTVKNNMYVDDLLVSCPNESDAISLIADAADICAKGGFRLTKWLSSSVRVLESVPEKERSKDVEEICLEDSVIPDGRALGVFWKVSSDCLGFRIEMKDKPCTRRGVLSVVSSLFDPIGLASPFVLRAKILLQDLCKRNKAWDEEIKDDDKMKWQEWLSNLPHIEELQIERCYKPKDFGRVATCQIHTFSDASNMGYGVVSYIRLENESGDVHCAFLLGKSRVAPLKKITIPRMELTAATVAVRLHKIIIAELEFTVDDTFFWTDSMSVIRYISNENARFHTFVANRIALIRDASSVTQWRYVDTKSNPADLASRGALADKLIKDDVWIHGPTFLWKDESQWPKVPEYNTSIPEKDSEIKSVATTIKLDESATVVDFMEKLISDVSDWTRLKRVVGWMLVGMKNLKERVLETRQATLGIKQNETDPSRYQTLIQTEISKLRKQRLVKAQERIKSARLTPDVLESAEKLMLKYVQRKHFSTEFKDLESQGRGKLNQSSALHSLDPFISPDGLLRVGGRLERAEIPFDSKHPILLPKGSPLSTLILRNTHSRTGHLGRNSTLSLLRQKYWLVGATSAVKQMIYKCTICRKYQAPRIEQKMANLPASRLSPDDPPFSHTGLDYFGPFELKRGRSTVKRYGVIFTCLNIRAIHLEVAHSLSTDSCINAIRRFIARRGSVKSMLSDNGTNLVGSERELREEILKWNVSQIQSTLRQQGIHWSFNPPAASHFGGVWERLIRTVRKILFSLMKEQVIKLDDEGLCTLFCEVEKIVNGRPLTELSNDPNDMEAITPNHLLSLRAGEYFPPGIFSKEDVYAKRRWRQIQYLANVFWARWSKEYLPLLQARQRWFAPRRNLSVGDLVLVMDNSPRNAWCLARVLEVVTDKKGLVRVAKIKTKFAILQRPVTKLCLILENDMDQ